MADLSERTLTGVASLMESGIIKLFVDVPLERVNEIMWEESSFGCKISLFPNEKNENYTLIMIKKGVYA